jgi:hypothetical protein
LWLYSSVSLSLYLLSSSSCCSYTSNLDSMDSSKYDPDAPSAFCDASMKPSTDPADCNGTSIFFASPVTYRILRSISSHRLMYDTYRRWNGVSSGFKSVN